MMNTKDNKIKYLRETLEVEDELSSSGGILDEMTRELDDLSSVLDHLVRHVTDELQRVMGWDDIPGDPDLLLFEEPGAGDPSGDSAAGRALRALNRVSYQTDQLAQLLTWTKHL